MRATRVCIGSAGLHHLSGSVARFKESRVPRRRSMRATAAPLRRSACGPETRRSRGEQVPWPCRAWSRIPASSPPSASVPARVLSGRRSRPRDCGELLVCRGEDQPIGDAQVDRNSECARRHGRQGKQGPRDRLDFRWVADRHLGREMKRMWFWGKALLRTTTRRSSWLSARPSAVAAGAGARRGLVLSARGRRHAGGGQAEGNGQ